jgi:ABC-type nitrate/sulfonate/bicarbonate transport system permease component
MENHKPEGEYKLFKGVMRLNAKFLGLILGILLGLFIFIATNWLLIKAEVAPDGRRIIGPHLQLLSQFFIGYRVSFIGSIIGFLYGFAIGSISGSAIGFIYNKIVDLRRKS